MPITGARSPLDEAIAALVNGQHRDPFALLGPHLDDDGTPIVRAFQPAAQSIDVRLVATGAIVPMEKIHPAGLYECRVRHVGQAGHVEARPDYRLRITFHEHHLLEIDDPYRYGRVLTDFDLHLVGEGTHYRMFDKLGSHRIEFGGTMGV